MHVHVPSAACCFLFRFVLGRGSDAGLVPVPDVRGESDTRGWYISAGALLRAPGDAAAALVRTMSRYARQQVQLPPAGLDVDAIVESQAAFVTDILGHALERECVLPLREPTALPSHPGDEPPISLMGVVADASASTIPPHVPVLDPALFGPSDRLDAVMDASPAAAALLLASPQTDRLWREAHKLGLIRAADSI
ncbi:uncharacterized protein AMSG_05213 [Thecamonas trahens ATCC 50062]|uniref:Uncharacterized protein n=1 Tax=Thecamonas trahens ATCC 50062 TaxID=461836 RepID=A0A0L0DAG4_THETB|nr:hypothetical protein AMSG_05213 [Thecamonas trahens ATCC 50062]KNC49225.1 hypothetical protein AMSG_05213 [Thecamonas trahens ATCC 50062]|eukprot:XP_013757944.1 hypothetical protein AMSG_05213 [Thecamonas trahens ATCC 50062]